MNRWLTLTVATLAILAGCESESSGIGGNGGMGGAGGTGGTPRTCATDIGVGEVQAFGMQTPSTTEGITFHASGELFVSNNNDADDQLLAFMPDGTFEVVAEAESILGLASHPSGIIGAGIATGEVLRIDPATGTTEVIAQDLGEPNFVVITPWDTILVSDDTSTDANTITEVTFDGGDSVWVDGVPTPNGMVFSLDQGTLYVAATFQGVGLWQVPVSEDGQADMPEKWIDFGQFSFPDGVAIDSLGNVYVALNGTGQIAQVAPDSSVTMIAEGVDSVASLAFGQGEYDPCSIYATNLRGTQIWRVGIGILGTEQ